MTSSLGAHSAQSRHLYCCASLPHQVYKECTDPPYNALAHQDGLPSTAELIFVLEHAAEPWQPEVKVTISTTIAVTDHCPSSGQVRVLLYSGQFDVICNHLGTEKLLAKLDWAGRQVPHAQMIDHTLK